MSGKLLVSLIALVTGLSLALAADPAPTPAPSTPAKEQTPAKKAPPKAAQAKPRAPKTAVKPADQPKPQPTAGGEVEVVDEQKGGPRRSATGTYVADEPYVPQIEVNPRTGREVIVITNETLTRRFGPPVRSSRQAEAEAEGTSEGAEAAGGGEGAEKVEAGQGAPGGVPGSPDQGPVVDPAQRAAQIQAELQRLQQKEKTIKNPFLRPVPETPQEREKEKGLMPTQLLEKNRQDMDKLRKELEKVNAQKAAQEAQPEKK